MNTLSLAFRVMGRKPSTMSSFYDLIIYNNTAEDFGVPFVLFLDYGVTMQVIMTRTLPCSTSPQLCTYLLSCTGY